MRMTIRLFFESRTFLVLYRSAKLAFGQRKSYLLVWISLVNILDNFIFVYTTIVRVYYFFWTLTCVMWRHFQNYSPYIKIASS